MKQFLSKRGFTLIEILIALSIISILFVILIPQVNGYFEKSREAGIRSAFRDFQASSKAYLKDSFGNNLHQDSLNKFLDSKYEIVDKGSNFETKAKDPWGKPYGVEFGNQRITFYSYGKEGKNKHYTLTSYYYQEIVDFCTMGFSTNNLKFTSIKNTPASFICGEDIPSAIIPPSGSLETPTNFTANNITQTQAELSWSSVVNATNYILKRNGVVIYTGNNTNYSDISLTANITYQYEVAAKNDSYVSLYAPLTVKTEAPTPPVTYSPPTNFRVTNTTESTVSLAWDSVPNAVAYLIVRNNDIFKSHRVSQLTLTDMDLEPNTTYTYSIFAEFANGTSESVTLITKTLPITTFGSFKEISSGGEYAIALKNNGTILAWGRNSVGQHGDGTTITKYTPVQVNSINDVKSVSAGETHTVALKNDGTVWTWGHNYFGQHGDGTTITKYTPVQVNSINDVKSISAGYGHTVALKNDGTVWTWGYNFYGQLGDGTTVSKYTPVQVNSINDVKSISAGESHTVALKNDGTVWTWGYNFHGGLGDGTSINRNTPVQVKDLTNVKMISAGVEYTVALKNDGTVWSWGYNSAGQLGHGSGHSVTPVQAKDLTNINSISAGYAHTVALKNDGTVWAWGDNFYGILGDGTSTSRNTPVQVKKLTNVKYISAGKNHNLAIRNDGAIWAWGRNNYSQLGDGTTTSRNTPVQVME